MRSHCPMTCLLTNKTLFKAQKQLLFIDSDYAELKGLQPLIYKLKASLLFRNLPIQ